MFSLFYIIFPTNSYYNKMLENMFIHGDYSVVFSSFKQ